jgi:hypothetical protein
VKRRRVSPVEQGTPEKARQAPGFRLPAPALLDLTLIG